MPRPLERRYTGQSYQEFLSDLVKSEGIANPYYAEDMKECGSIVRRIGDKPAGGKRGAP